MKNKSILYQLIEQNNPSEERLDARLRKRRQRDREKQIRQVDPFQMVLVVRNKQNGEILIIDKESYSPKYHELLVAPEKINQAVLKQFLDDPKFIQTETSKKLFGDIKKEAPKEEEESVAKKSEQTSSGSSLGSAQVSNVGAPKKEIPFTRANVSSGPIIALGMMNGMQSKNLQKIGISQEQLDEYNSSEDIQSISMQMAKQMSFYFKNIVGRNINEYIPSLIENQPFQTTNFWKNMGGYDALPKSNIAFRHKCVDESRKDKKCEETMCGCSEAGIVPSEQMVTFAIKYGPSAIVNGKLSNDSKTTFYCVASVIDALLLEQQPQEIILQLNEKEKSDLEKLQEDIKFLKKICSVTYNEKIKNRYDSNLEKINALNKLTEDMRSKIERIINSNSLYKTLFINEAVTGYSKFSDMSPAHAQGIMAVVPDTYALSMELIDLNFSRKVIGEDVKFAMNFKSSVKETPDEKSELENCKIRFGGSCPKIVNPQKFEIRKLMKSYLTESKFSYSKLNYLFEQVDPKLAEDEFFSAVENANGITDFMNLFAITPAQITIEPIDFFSVVAIDYSSERNVIVVNGKKFQVPVQISPITPDDSESIIENSLLSKLVFERRERNYRKEYDEYHSKPEQRANRSKRVLARRKMTKLGHVKKGDGKDVDHVNGDPQDNSTSNLKAVPKSKNRAKK